MSCTAPAHPATARGLITDHDGRWLLVLPVLDHRWWHLPGGLIEHNEPPTAACRREVREELGIDLIPARCWPWRGPGHAASADAPGSRSSSAWEPTTQTP